MPSEASRGVHPRARQHYVLCCSGCRQNSNCSRRPAVTLDDEEKTEHSVLWTASTGSRNQPLGSRGFSEEGELLSSKPTDALMLTAALFLHIVSLNVTLFYIMTQMVAESVSEMLLLVHAGTVEEPRQVNEHSVSHDRTVNHVDIDMNFSSCPKHCLRYSLDVLTFC